MKCCFSKRDIPTEKLFVLYYPPSMAHQDWDQSVYAAARAGEAIQHLIAELENFHERYVIRRGMWKMFLAGGLGLTLLGLWAYRLAAAWEQTGWIFLLGVPLFALIPLTMAKARLDRLRQRMRLWKAEGKALVERELAEIRNLFGKMPDDPTAEDAAAVMRRECPALLSEIAFSPAHYRAFTYLDFVLYPQLKNPGSREELPARHSIYRDAYYVGDVVYDGWRLFHKGQPELVDPRFAGSGGKRGVI